jgi:phosphoglycerate dehydrogenase-like enzyme/predicted dehydrogenase
MKNKIPKIGFIGVGMMATKVHLPILKKLADEGLCELVTVCDLDGNAAAKAAKDFSFQTFFSSADEMLRIAEIDTLYVISGADVHYRYGLEAVKKGLNLFVEKPPAPSYEAFDEMFKAVEASGKVIAVAGFNRRFQPGLQYIKSLVESGLKINLIEATFHKTIANGVVPFGVQSWLMANGIHAVDVVAYIMGSLPSELYSVSNKVDKNKSADENFAAVMKWPDGSVATLLSDNTDGGRKERYVFHAAGKTYEVEGGLLTQTVNDKTTTVPLDISQGFEEEHRAFFNSIDTAKNPINSFSQVRDSMRLTALIERGFVGQVEVLAYTSKTLPSHDTSSLAPSIVNKGGILVLTPSIYKIYLSKLPQGYFAISKEELVHSSEEKKQEIVSILTGQGEALSKDVFLMCPNIKVVGIAGLSLKKYNPELAFNVNIPLVNASGSYADSVAEFVVMQAIAALRHAITSHEIMRKGGWGTQALSLQAKLSQNARLFILKNQGLASLRKILLPAWKNLKEKPSFQVAKASSNSLKSASIGIIGFGAISKALVSLFEVHGVSTIKIFSEFKDARFASTHNVEYSSLDQVMSCDVVVLARGLSERTKHSVGAKELSFLRSGSVFINISRGEIIEHQALVDRLKKGDVYACLDVFEPEPPKKNDHLRKMKNVFLTSHLAGGTMEMYKDAPREVFDKILNYLSGMPVQTITAEQYKNMS